MGQKRTTVAVVDDEPTVCVAVQRLLRSAGYDVHTCSSGAELLLSLESELPDCVIIDIQMAAMDGYEVLAELQKRYKHLPAILMTAYEAENDEEHVRECGGAGFLRKPFDEGQLISLIEAAL